MRVEMTPYTSPRKVDSHSRGRLFLPQRHNYDGTIGADGSLVITGPGGGGYPYPYGNNTPPAAGLVAAGEFINITVGNSVSLVPAVCVAAASFGLLHRSIMSGTHTIIANSSMHATVMPPIFPDDHLELPVFHEMQTNEHFWEGFSIFLTPFLRV